MFFPYITPRNFTFRIIVELALTFWVGLIILHKEFRPRLSALIIALAVFVLVIGAANLFGINPYRSFWSNFERMEGYISILHLAVYFLILTTVFRKKDWTIFFNLFIVAGLASAFYGLFQKFRLFGVAESIQGGLRPDGTIGNPTYFAAYLLLIFIISLILFLKSGSLTGKIFYGVIAVFLLWVIYLTATRGAILSLMVGVPLFALLYLIFAKPSKTTKIVLASILILAVATPVIIWIFRNSSLVKDSYILSRLSFGLESKTVSSRFLLWNLTWKAFKERPLLGWGQENYVLAFSKNYDPRMYSQEPWFDRAHNVLLDWLINGGIFGLFAYLGILGSAIYCIWCLIKKGNLEIKEGLIIGVGLIIYFIQNFFVFDNFNTYVIFFTFLAYINYYHQRSDLSIGFDSKFFKFSLGGFIGALAVVLIAIYFISILPIQQSLGIINAFKASATASGDPAGETSKNFQRALSKNSFGTGEVADQFLRMATSLIDIQQVPESSRLQFVIEAVNASENYLQKFPTDIRMHLALGSLYNKLAFSSRNAGLLERGRNHILAAIELSPNKQDIYTLLAENYLYAGESEQAISVLQKGVAIFPNNSGPQTYLAILAILVDKEEIVDQVLGELKRIFLEDSKNPESQALVIYRDSLQKILGVYKNNKNQEKIAKIKILLKEIAQ